ncbi:redox-sensitive transcriptional activator SoxR [Aliamphritea spongicola]|uniref:redox-sensitive transcriptional activator SoxR n=1 Tax=Aliamphritea spongicola TaxID=707589 RepID=UPI00196AB5A2|nr:redox-sensitive transcriptional activator SoxR [Aliamphritea spongicola]
MKAKTVPKKELSVGEVSSRSGLPVSTIHFYEAKGLISSQRNNGNHRRYLRGVLRKLAVIKVAQKAGIPLSEIKAAMSQLSNDKTITADDWTRLAESWQAQLDERINQLSRLRDTLGYCIGCGCLSVNDCELINPEDKLKEKGPGAYYLDPDVPLGADDAH